MLESVLQWEPDAEEEKDQAAVRAFSVTVRHAADQVGSARDVLGALLRLIQRVAAEHPPGLLPPRVLLACTRAGCLGSLQLVRCNAAGCPTDIRGPPHGVELVAPQPSENKDEEEEEEEAPAGLPRAPAGRPLRVLSIDGGGIRGLIPALLLQVTCYT